MAVKNIAKIFCPTARYSATQYFLPKFYSSNSRKFEFLKTDKTGVAKNIAIITFNRPKLNVLNHGLLKNINEALKIFEEDDSVRVIILTGNEKAFSAGGDLTELQHCNFSQNIKENLLAELSRVTSCRKPIIAAVNGYALGGGFELAMMCDIIYAGNTAKFGLPELVLGTIPSSGGTQRLARIIGKSKAMETLLTGNLITADEAEKIGLISKVFSPKDLLSETLKLAEKISGYSPLIVGLCKESVNSSYETNLRQGLQFEKRLFHSTFATKDREEGMKAFVEKRTPIFTNK